MATPTAKQLEAEWASLRELERQCREAIAQRDNLLAALEVANEALCDLPLMDPRVVQIRAAIGKATRSAA